MSILKDKANLVVAAKARKAGKLYAYNPQLTTGTGHPEFTVDRNCKRTEIDSEGYIRQIAPYMPAFSWVDGKPTIDTQPDSINQILYPFDVGNSYYTKSGLTVDDNAGAFYNSPFKDSTGNVVKCGRKLVASASSPTIELATGIDMSATTNSGKTRIIKPINEFQYTLNGIAIDFATETYETGVVVDKLADGYYAVKLTEESSSADKVTLVGTSISSGDMCYLAGTQLEADKPTAFINDPADAEGSTVERLGETEVATYTGDSESGTLIANMGAWDTINSSAFKIIKINDGTSSNQIYLYYWGNSLAVDITVGGITITLGSDVSDITNKNNMIAVRWKQDNVSLWYNGTKIKETLSWNTFGANILNKITLAFAGDSKVIETTDYLTDSELIELMA